MGVPCDLNGGDVFQACPNFQLDCFIYEDHEQNLVNLFCAVLALFDILACMKFSF